MRTHTIRINQVAAGKYCVAGSGVSILSTSTPVRDAALALREAGHPDLDFIAVNCGEITILPVSIGSILRPHRAPPKFNPSTQRGSSANPIPRLHSASADNAATARQKATEMTRITNPASPGRANPIDSQGWVGPPIAGARPVNIGGRHPALPDVHAPVRQHEPMPSWPSVPQHAPVNQSNAHH